MRDRSGALHVPWRVLLFLLVAAAMIAVSQAIAVLAYPFVQGQLAELGYLTGLLCLALLAAHAVVLRIAGAGSWESVGLASGASAPGKLGIGLLVGSSAVAAPALALLAVGWYTLVPGSEGNAVLVAIKLALALLPAALWEELLARGYLFSVLRERWGAPVALVVTSVGFGLLHLGNPGTNLHSVLQVIFAGFWLGGILLATGSLYAAWLAHAAWNWTIAAVLHAPVSGLEFATPGWELRDSGPDWATGGAWGPEGGIFVLVTMSLTLVYLIRRRARRGES